MIGAYAKITAVCGTLQGRAKSQSLGPLQEPRILLCIFGVAPKNMPEDNYAAHQKPQWGKKVKKIRVKT